MLDVLAHRGPDGRGSTYDEPDLAMGAVRFAITDGPASDQPISVEGVSLVFNGEIYNYQAVRALLEGRGHRFITDGDGEVIIRAYLEWNLSYVEHLDGMFAFGMWDAPRRRLVLARDPAGIKPLAYWAAGQQIAFSSEPTALFAYDAITMGVDREAIASYVVARFVLPPRTAFIGIEKLAPGSMLVAEPGRRATMQFWSPPDANSVRATPESLLAELSEAVRTTSFSSHPVGVLLSGGVDSATVAALAARASIGFTVGYAGRPDEDERASAALVCQAIGIERHEVVIDESSVRDLVVESARSLCEPIYTPVTVSTYALTQLASGHTRVVLSGDGSDELFMGYQHMREVVRLPRDTWRQEYVRRLGWLDDEGIRCFSSEFIALTRRVAAELAGSLPHERPSEGIRRVEYFMKLPEYHLARVDRTSMRHPVEVRLPFLRRGVVDLALSIPAETLTDGVREKSVLRDAMKARLPEAVRMRPKQKFTAPYLDWLAGPLRDLTHDALDAAGFISDFDLNRSELQRLLQDEARAPEQYGSTVWGMLSLALWHAQVLGGVRLEMRRAA